MRRGALPVALALVSLVGCSVPVSGTSTTDTPTDTTASPVATAAPSASVPGAKPPPAVKAGHLAYGPGPVSPYTVQPQPAPGTCHYRYTSAKQPLPDTRCTPGALNPKVTQATLATTICRVGYTTSIRPPQSVTSPEKIANAVSYGYTGSLHVAEYDHLVSLELGGDPNDPRNLWVEPPSPGHKPTARVSNPKDGVESRAKLLVCKDEVPLATMQRAIAANWTTALAAVAYPSGG